MRHVKKPALAAIRTQEIRNISDFAQDSDAYKAKIQNAGQGYRPPAETKFELHTKSQEALLEIYQRKCGFCEQQLTKEPNLNNSVSVEHFRPKNRMLYHWLAMEWTNLLPSCRGCNNPKGDTFEIKQTRIKSPFNEAGEWDEMRFDAAYLNTLEAPLLLHPEYDDPKDYLFFNKEGLVQAINDNERGTATIRLVDLNGEKREGLILQRAAILQKIRKEISEETRSLVTQHTVPLADIPAPSISIAYDGIFRKIVTNAFSEKASFTLLWYCMVNDFKTLIATPLADELCKNEAAHQALETFIDNAFKTFLQKLVEH